MLSCFSVTQQDLWRGEDQDCIHGKPKMCVGAGQGYEHNANPSVAAERYLRVCTPPDNEDGCLSAESLAKSPLTDPVLARWLVTELCRRRDSSACLVMADWQDKGDHGFVANAEQARAMRWQLCLSARGQPMSMSAKDLGTAEIACSILSSSYETGRGVPKDAVLAAKLGVLTGDLTLEYNENLWSESDQIALQQRQDLEKLDRDNARREAEAEHDAQQNAALGGALMSGAQQIQQRTSSIPSSSVRVSRPTVAPSYNHNGGGVAGIGRVAVTPHTQLPLGSHRPFTQVGSVVVVDPNAVTAGQPPQPQKPPQPNQPTNPPPNGTTAGNQSAQLQACVAQAPCDTPGSCSPTVPYGDRWGERREYETALSSFNVCTGNWTNECWPKLRATLPDAKMLADRIDQLNKRFNQDPSWVQKQCNSTSLATSEDVRQVTFWCNNLRKDCPGALQKADDVLTAARQLDECVFTAEFEATKRQEHDNECHAKLGGAP